MDSNLKERGQLRPGGMLRRVHSLIRNVPRAWLLVVTMTLVMTIISLWTIEPLDFIHINYGKKYRLGDVCPWLPQVCFVHRLL